MASQRDPPQRDSFQRDPFQRDPFQRDPFQRDPPQRDPPQRDPPQRDSSQRGPSQASLTVANGLYRLSNMIGEGSFGRIYLGYRRSDGKEVAVKIEDSESECRQLEFEKNTYALIHRIEQRSQLSSSLGGGAVGFPEVYYFGREETIDAIGHKFNVLVMERLGPSLEDLRMFCGGKFSLKTTLMLADQMISRVEWLHSRNTLHRDVKPDNFLMGINESSHVVYMVDFGLSKRYLIDGKHIPFRDGKPLTGTARYCSLGTHAGAEQSRRDDLESVGYVLAYFLRGRLPWQGIKSASKAKKHQMISHEKSSKAALIFEGYPQEFEVYMRYVRGLKFDEKPDYAYLKRLFRDLFKRVGYVWDFKYDWTNKNE